MDTKHDQSKIFFLSRAVFSLWETLFLPFILWVFQIGIMSLALAIYLKIAASGKTIPTESDASCKDGECKQLGISSPNNISTSEFFKFSQVHGLSNFFLFSLKFNRFYLWIFRFFLGLQLIWHLLGSIFHFSIWANGVSFYICHMVLDIR